MTNPYYVDTAASAMTGITSGLGSSPYSRRFKPNNTAPIQGAAQGAIAGAQYGPAGAVAGGLFGGLTSAVKEPINVGKSIRDVNTSFQDTSFDEYGRPIYSAGQDVIQGVQDLQDLDKTAKWDSWNLLGLNRKARRKQSQVRQGIQTAQNSYNQAEISYRNQMNAMEDYNQRMNSDARLYNLYR